MSLFSEARLRGYSLSGGRPVGVLDFAYDDASGFYADASGMAVFRGTASPAPLGAEVDAGYARQLKSGTTIDLGITHSVYSHYSGTERGKSYTEVYVGVARGDVSSRLFVSPHYFARGLWTAYGELDGNLRPARKWTIEGHVGVLVPLREPSGGHHYRPDFDWRLGVSRELGRLTLHAAWSDGAPGHDYYRERRHSRSALVLGATLAL